MQDHTSTARTIHTRPIADFKPDPHNARQHSARNLEAIRESLHAFGQVKPIVALDDGTVIAGNGTLAAAKMLGWTHLAAVIFADVEKAKAFAIADNRTAELAEWDQVALATALQSFSDEAIAAAGFDLGEAASIMSAAFSAAVPLPEAPPDLPPPPPPPRERPDLPTSTTRTVHLHFTPEAEAKFTKAVKKLAKQFGTANVTDTVLTALLKAVG